MSIRFDCPEFYDCNRVIARFPRTNGTELIIVSEGDRKAYLDCEILTTTSQFINAFPDGVIYEESNDFQWESNAWFAIYDNGEVVDEPFMSLTEAINTVLEIVS